LSPDELISISPDKRLMTSVEREMESASHLPAPVPDLVVEENGGQWRILRFSSRLARLAGVGPEDGRGRDLDRLFSGVVPSLGELAREALEREETVTDVRMRLPGQKGLLVAADVAPGGLSPDYRRRMVTFTFRPVAAEAAGAAVFHGLVGDSPAMREVFRKIVLYGRAEAAVVITGETGTGKELAARALHAESSRRDGPYVAVNCSAIAEELLESELFGHEKGAFTGAVRTHRGRFERADGGTLFLDEIGDMPLHTQSRLLRVLEEGQVERVGAEGERKVDVRVLAATNVPLEQAVGQGRFRPDLYHRLSVLRLHLPPLRRRTEDIPRLIGHFLRIFEKKYSRHVERLTPEAVSLLQSYLWPGNIRELRNVLERVFVETQGEVIGARSFGEWVRERQDFTPGGWGLEANEGRPTQPVIPPYPLVSERIAGPPGRYLEAEILPEDRGRGTTRPAELDSAEIRRAWRATAGNLTAAARLLGVHRATLYRYMDKLGLSRKDLDEV
jgi:DNA-binding NtrC family response regulator